ncbi:hypothetical protein E3T23_00940 [Cryobacterium cheniae]|uniref:Uncharacterized protein n=1 Tax=Cryobacterium cheniae TaxID=1259262 RepID=A0A4R8Y0B3_9MICO|nr:hypothetical protein [Cryobacterium cheniae]TFC83861.1 hypothetical protein E3T23_00940 [Cryobacterium cheniae]
MTPQPWIAALTVLGFILTAGGLIAAYLSAKRQPGLEEKRIEKSQELSKAYMAEIAELTRQQSDGAVGYMINVRYHALYAENQLIRPTIESIEYLAAEDSKRLIEMILVSTRGNLIWAGVGLMLSSAASLWSVFI